MEYSTNTCPECKGNIIQKAHEKICRKCGLVIVFLEYAAENRHSLMQYCAEIECEISRLEPEEQAEFLAELGLEDSGKATGSILQSTRPDSRSLRCRSLA